MDKLDLCLLPLACMIRMTFFLMFLAKSLPSIVLRTTTNTLSWIALLCIHPILFVLSGLHTIVQIRAIQFVLNYVQQFTPMRILLFWPRFYYSILKPKENRRSLWQMLENPVPSTGPKAGGISTRIICLNKNKCCYSHYQVQGAHAHLHQKINMGARGSSCRSYSHNIL